MRDVRIDLNKYFTEVAVIEEDWTDIDGSKQTDYFKDVKLTKELTLSLYQDGSATLAIKSEDLTFHWDDEAAQMFERFSEVKAADMFGLIQRKRWGTA